MINKRLAAVLPAFLCTCLLLGSSELHAREIKCWQGQDNIRECGSVVPPEFSQQRIEILNERGVVIKVVPAAKTKAELAEIARLKKIEHQKQLRITEQKRKDNILLQTYTAEKDLLIDQEDKTVAIKSIIDITNSNTRSLQKNLSRLQKRAADYERSGQSMPEVLTGDMDNLLRQIKDNDDFISKKQQAMIQLSKQFDAALKRYRLLKKGKVKYE